MDYCNKANRTMDRAERCNEGKAALTKNWYHHYDFGEGVVIEVPLFYFLLFSFDWVRTYVRTY